MFSNASTQQQAFSFSCSSIDGNWRNASFYYTAIFSTSILIGVSSPVAVVGNALILAAIWKKTFVRTPFHILLSGLVIADLCTGLIAQPFLVTIELILLTRPKEVCDNPKFFFTLFGITNGSATYFIGITMVFITLISIERWLHMYRRSLVTAQRGYLTIAIGLVLPVPLVSVRLFSDVKYEIYSRDVYTTILVLMLFCFVTTSFAYFKVYQLIRQRQQQVQGHDRSQTFGRPAIDLAKYKKSVISILFILLLFSVCFLPFLVCSGMLLSLGESPALSVVFGVSMLFLFLSSALNPCLYLWRMKDIRNGVKQLFWDCFFFFCFFVLSLLLKNEASIKADYAQQVISNKGLCVFLKNRTAQEVDKTEMKLVLDASYLNGRTWGCILQSMFHTETVPQENYCAIASFEWSHTRVLSP